jgi:hypothetical protein
MSPRDVYKLFEQLPLAASINVVGLLCLPSLHAWTAISSSFTRTSLSLLHSALQRAKMCSSPFHISSGRCANLGTRVVLVVRQTT